MLELFIDVEDGPQLLADEQGKHYAQLEEARAEARQSLREVIFNQTSCSSGHIVKVSVRDKQGTNRYIATMTFEEHWDTDLINLDGQLGRS